MGKVLVASIGELDVREILGRELFSRLSVEMVSGAGQARRKLGGDTYSMLIINTPLEDEMGAELAIQAAERTTAGILVLVRQGIYAMAADKLEPYGVIVMPKPFNGEDARRASRLLLATSARLQGMKRATVKLKSQLDELKTVYRAKCVLMQYLGMTEEEAHKYIEKQAMDSRRSRFEVALDVIRTYEN